MIYAIPEKLKLNVLMLSTKYLDGKQLEIFECIQAFMLDANQLQNSKCFSAALKIEIKKLFTTRIIQRTDI